jgi:hypothetical protein
MTEQDPLHPSMSGPDWPGPRHAGLGPGPRLAGLGPGPLRPGEMAPELPAAGTAALATGVANRRRRGVRVTTAAAVALGLAIAGGVAGAATSSGSSGTPSSSTGTALAATGGGAAMCGAPPVAVGTVKSVGDDTFTLTTASGSTVTVDVGSSTTYTDPGVSSATFANVTVGEHVAVIGTESSNTVTATKVLIGLPPSGMAPPGNGSSSSNSTSSDTGTGYSVSGGSTTA